MEKFTKQRERNDKLEVRPLRAERASFREHTSAACRPHLATASPAGCTVSIKSLAQTSSWNQNLSHWKWSLAQQVWKPLVLLHTPHPYPHPSPLSEGRMCTAPWHIVDYNVSGCLLQLSCMSDLGWGISLYTKLSIQVIKIGFFSFCKCNTFHIFTSSCLDSISLFSFLVLSLSYLMWISRAWCP